MNTLTIDYIRNYGFKIHASYEGLIIGPRIYSGYTLREAIRKFRRDNCLVGKHLVRIDLR